MKCSVDKIKILISHVGSDVMNNLNMWLSENPYVSEHYTSKKLSTCHYNFLYCTNEGNLYVGIMPNWIQCGRNQCVVLEFNPNKIDISFFPQLAPLFCDIDKYWSIMSIDLAVDIYRNYNDFILLKRDVREKKVTFGHRFVETVYLGDLGHNHVKFYNKSIEQKADFEWSRFEITLKNLDKIQKPFTAHIDLSDFVDYVSIPQLYVYNNSPQFSTLKDTTYITLMGLLSDIDLLYTIKDYKTRKKYESLLKDFLVPVPITHELLLDTYNDYINYCKNIQFLKGRYDIF